jgi:DNA-binding SARP family transcriptional activator
VLGPTEVLRNGVPVRFRGSRELALVALLAIEANRVVSSERLVEDLWGEGAPSGALRTLRVYVSRIRKAFEGSDDLLVTRPAGYLLRATPEMIDAARFEDLVREGRDQAAAGDHRRAADTLRAALDLWRGPALAEVATAPNAAAEAARLEEARLVALEERLDADLVCGRHGEVAAELDSLTRAHPFRERLWGQRITALYRAGRQADALRAYQELRRSLGEQLGIDPSPELARLETAVLRHDPDLTWSPGTTVAAAPPVVTFLFTDVVGSTELLDQLGDTAADKVRQVHFALLRHVLAAHGGAEVKSLGDGLMVAFASPLAAVTCAVEMQKAVSRATAGPAGSVAVRIGLHAGEPTQDEGDFFGTPVVVAKRLCDQAQGGQILASVLVWDLVGRHRDHGCSFRPLGRLPLKGLSDPVAAGEVVWQSSSEPAAAPAGATDPSPLPAPLARDERLPLVGRAREMAGLDAAWTETTARQRRLLLLGGEPGIGKSRLTADFARRVHGDGTLVLFGRCDEGMGVPYQPFVEALGRYLREAPVPQLGRMAGELTRLVPEVAERVPGLPPPSRSEPESERYRLFEAVAAWLSAASEQRPVVFVIDDLHWATKPTLLLLSHVIRSDEAMSALLLATYRDSALDVTPEVADAVAELLRQPGVDRLRLAGLDEAEVAALIEAHARRELDDDGRALARVIHGETAGNPFFVREVLRHLTERGDVIPPGEGFMVGRSGEVDVPDSVREVVGRRLTRLPDKTDQILALAAVLGEHFDLDVLVEASAEPADSVLQTLDPAISARLVEETAVGRFRFAHALVRSTLEDALGPTRRAQLHLRAAEALVALGGQWEGRAAVLAAHYQSAGSLAPTERVIDALLAAGDEAAAALAWEQVGGHWEAALGLMEQTCPGTPQQADLLARLADALYVTGVDLAAANNHAEKAAALFHQLGLDRRAAVLRSRVAGYLSSNGLYGVMDIPRSLELFRDAEATLKADPESLAYGYWLGTLSTATGLWGARPDEALETAPRARLIARKLEHEGLGIIGEMVHGFVLVSTGSVDEGLALVEQAWEAADRLDHRILGMRTAHIRTYWALTMRDPGVAIDWAERELSRSRLAHVPIQRRTLQGQLAWGYALAGRLLDAERVGAEAGDIGVSPAYAPALKLWQGDWPAAEAALRDGTRRCREMGDRMDEVLLYAWTAEVCRLRGDLVGAAACLDDALAIAVSAPLRVYEAGIRIDFGILDVDRGRPETARAHLDQAAALIDGKDWGGLGDRLALGEAALEAGHDLARGSTRFEEVVPALRARLLPWDEAEALLFWSRSARPADPALATEKRAAAAEIYRRCGAGAAWFERAEALTGPGEGRAQRAK